MNACALKARVLFVMRRGQAPAGTRDVQKQLNAIAVCAVWNRRAGRPRTSIWEVKDLTITTTNVDAINRVPADGTFDTRWAAWLARGRAHERRVRRRLMICGALLAAGGAVVYAFIGY